MGFLARVKANERRIGKLERRYALALRLQLGLLLDNISRAEKEDEFNVKQPSEEVRRDQKGGDYSRIAKGVVLFTKQPKEAALVRRTFLGSNVAGDKVSGLDVGRLATLVVLLVLRELALAVILGRKREDLALGILEPSNLLVALFPDAFELANLSVREVER